MSIKTVTMVCPLVLQRKGKVYETTGICDNSRLRAVYNKDINMLVTTTSPTAALIAYKPLTLVAPLLMPPALPPLGEALGLLESPDGAVVGAVVGVLVETEEKIGFEVTEEAMEVGEPPPDVLKIGLVPPTDDPDADAVVKIVPDAVLPPWDEDPPLAGVVKVSEGTLKPSAVQLAVISLSESWRDATVPGGRAPEDASSLRAHCKHAVKPFKNDEVQMQESSVQELKVFSTGTHWLSH